MTSPRFSIVIPSKDEAESLAGLLKEISTALAGDRFEVIVVDDGSMDGTAGVLQQLAEVQPFLRRLVHTQCCGKSAAILTGVRAARAPLIATLDGDGQNDPCYLPALLALMAEEFVGSSSDAGGCPRPRRYSPTPIDVRSPRLTNIHAVPAARPLCRRVGP
jgi:glycosyltransferase involved in cell wall biosynthesis